MSDIINKLNDLAATLNEYNSDSSPVEIDIYVPMESYYAINKECHEFIWYSNNMNVAIQPFDISIKTQFNIKFNINLQEK